MKMAAPMALMAAARDPQWSRLLIPLLHPLSRTCSSGPGPGPDPARQRLHKERRRLRREAAMEARSGGGGDKNGGGTEPRKWTEPPVFTYDVPTPPGEKKDTTVPLPKSYSPRYVEAAWYSWWEKEGFFTPEYHAQLPHREDATFAMCMPPPNVTGSLHLGHALTVAIQDAIVRWNRMRGRRVLWVPGCDHAGIATQVVVEQRLQRESGISRRDLTRDQFLQHVWRWKHEKGDEIYQQLRLLGSSLDWQRARFTMEAGYSEAVTEAFVRLYEAGLVYRGRQLVNWSCALGSAISDIEVESCPLKGRTLVSVPGYQEKVVFGELAHLAYPTEDGGGEVVVATTRPETVPGDVAVAVNPDDPRYSHLHGVRVRHPLTGHLLPVITDLLVDPDFGTGAVKVSPGHDHTDHQLAKRHQLPLLTVITDTGHMAANCPPWLQGMARFDARRAVMSAFTDSGLFRGSRDHPMVLRLCSRSRDVVEPLLRSQWFVRCKEMAASAMEAVDRGDLTFTPASLKSNWNIWLSNISDWCVSRQLWWGHRIPAYRVALPGSPPVQEVVGSDWVVGRSEVEARRIAARSLGVDENDITLTQDADVLDTWFSSALFPFAAMGWPRKTDDLCSFYPNSLLETGTDLLFFWVARMVMLGERVTGSLPFPQVLFHPLLRDSHGRKMSKSLGNVIDPRHLITGSSLQHLQEDLSHKHLHPREKQLVLEGQRRNFPHGIPECGTDAMRLTLCSRGHGEDVSVDVSSFLSARRFCNKMWNAVRFTLSSLPPDLQPLPPHQVRPEAAIDRWALGCLHSAVGACERGFLQKDLSMVTTAARHYWQHQLCDVYLECVKAVLQGSVRGDAEMGVQVLLLCVEGGLRLLAPLMPFLTEELWQRLPPTPHKLYPSISIAPYPSLTHTPDWSCREVELDFELVQEVVRAVRGVRAEYRLTREKPYLFVSGPPEISARLQPFLEPLQTLSRAGGVELLPPREGPPSGTVHAVVTHTCRVHLMLQGGVDPQTERARLADQRRRLEAELATAEGRSHGDGFTEKVPERVRSEQNSKMSALRAQLEWISEVERGLGEPGDRP